MLQEGEEALLSGDLDKANWALDSLIFMESTRIPQLWQRGLTLYYSGRYDEGMDQFERNMDANGSDPEEVLWHFICKAGLMGFEEALGHGFLRLRTTTDSHIPVPMSQVLDLFQGKGSSEDVIRVATSDTPGKSESLNLMGYPIKFLIYCSY